MLSIENKPLRMIAERGPTGRDWSAWLHDEPRQACGGATVTGAVRRWLKLNSDRFPGPYALMLDKEESTLDRRVVLLTSVTKCPACGGTGKYVGLAVVDDCKTCSGTGMVSIDFVVS